MKVEEIVKKIKEFEEYLKDTKDNNEALSIQYEIERLKNLKVKEP